MALTVAARAASTSALVLSLACTPASTTPRAVDLAPATGAAPATEQTAELMLVPQDGHAVEATAVAFSADGERIATGGFDQSLKVWDREGALVATFPCGGDAVYAVELEARRDTVAAACGGQAWLWDLRRLELRARFGQSVLDLAFEPRGREVATVGSGALLEVYAARTGKRLRGASANGTRQLSSVAWSPDGSTIATGSLDGSALLWRADTLASVPLPSGGARRVIAFSPDGGRLAVQRGEEVVVVDLVAGSSTSLGVGHGEGWRSDGNAVAVAVDRRVELRDARTGAVIASVRQKRQLERAALAPDGASVATVGVDDTVVRVLDVASGRELHALGKGTVERSHVVFSPDGRLLAATGDGIELWDARHGRLSRRLDASGRRVGGTCFSPDGALVVAQVTQGAAKIFRSDTGAIEATLVIDNPQDVTWYFAWSPHEQPPLLVLGVGEELWTWRPGASAARLAPPAGGWLSGLAFDPDGRRLAVATARDVELRDAPKFGSGTRRAIDSWNWSYAPSWSPDGKLIATSAGPAVEVWSAVSAKLVGTVGDRGMFAPALFSPDGRWLAYAGRDASIVLWPTSALAGVTLPARAGTGTVTASRPSSVVVAPYTGTARSLAFSPDATFLAVGSDAGELAVLSTKTGRRRFWDRAHGARVWTLAWHPSGTALASASASVRLLRTSDGAALTLRTVARGARLHAYAHSDGGLVSGELEALEALRFRRRTSESAHELVSYAEVRARVERGSLLDDFWSGRPLDGPAR